MVPQTQPISARLRRPASLRVRGVAVVMGVCLWCLTSAWSSASGYQQTLPSYLAHGKPAPEIALMNLDGQSVALADSAGEIRVIIFGSITQSRSAEALKILHEAARDLVTHAPTANMRFLYLVATRNPPAEVRAALNLPEGPPEITVLLDPERDAFGDYEINVLPTVIVVDADGAIIHATAGLLTRFTRDLTGALHVATGRMSRSDFEALLNGAKTEEVSAEHRRAERLTNMASKMASRGMAEAALGQYLQAVEIAPDYFPARLAAAQTLLSLKKFDDAETHFRGALEIHPQSLVVALGLAEIAIEHANPEKTEEAEALARDIVARNPSNARAHYLLARACELKGETREALKHYRRATELLFKEVARLRDR